MGSIKWNRFYDQSAFHPPARFSTPKAFAADNLQVDQQSLPVRKGQAQGNNSSRQDPAEPTPQENIQNKPPQNDNKPSGGPEDQNINIPHPFKLHHLRHRLLQASHLAKHDSNMLKQIDQQRQLSQDIINTERKKLEQMNGIEDEEKKKECEAKIETEEKKLRDVVGEKMALVDKRLERLARQREEEKRWMGLGDERGGGSGNGSLEGILRGMIAERGGCSGDGA